MKKISFIILLGSLFCAASLSAATRKVLFIGNSYTYTNNMPLILKNIAAAMGDTLVYDESDPGGYTFQQHSVYATTITKIFSQQWDVVVLQEQSQRPAFDPSQVAAEVYPYATRLDSMVNANDTCTETMFLMTWGRPTGDHDNCPFYPPICTYQGMQQRLRESYMEMGVMNNASVAPVGMAFKLMIDSAYSPWLISADSSHPALAGSYLEAAVLYSSIFHKRVLNCTYTSGLSATDVYTLQRVADKIVFDSLTLWQGPGSYPYAGFTSSVSGTNATFSSQSAEPGAHSWNFGDAATDTATNPVHAYGGAGTYTVTHTVTTDCFTETATGTVQIGTTGIEDLGYVRLTIMSPQGGGVVSFNTHMKSGDELRLIDMAGRTVRKYDAATIPATDQLMPGIYIYRLSTADGHVQIGKVAVY